MLKNLSPFLRICAALHFAALLALIAAPHCWPWLLAGLVVVHGAIAMAGLLPRAALLGPNLTHLPPQAARRGEVAITIDDGPDPAVTPQVLAILAEHGAHATFFCIAEHAARAPQLCRQALAAGHAIENHGRRHRTFTAGSGPAGWRDEAVGGQHMLATLTGVTPRFYRPIAGLRNPFLARVLQQSGMALASWTRRGYDTREKNPEVVYARLTRRLAAGDILLLHDGNAARDDTGQPIILAVLPRLLAELARRGLHPVTLPQACATPRASDAATPPVDNIS
jgi:peptidoglycan/xylan/chitin deacetylase (PgdA/CDA1 family)